MATKGQATRIKFYNLLPAGTAGDLFIPTDVTVTGAGTGPDGSNYSQNRATLHLHGGDNPWISDGTAHQWITPAGETGTLIKGVSQQNVPDMPARRLPGSATFYWPNGQSGRLMFYHDHAFGITRLNVYAGEAAGYLLVDPIRADVEHLCSRRRNSPGHPRQDLRVGYALRTRSRCSRTGTFAVDPLWASNLNVGPNHGQPLVPARVHAESESQ